MNKVLAWIGKGIAANIVAIFLIIVAIGLMTGSPAKGASAGWAVAKYELTTVGIMSAWGDDVGPTVDAGRTLGDKASGDKADKKA